MSSFENWLSYLARRLPHAGPILGLVGYFAACFDAVPKT